MKKFSIVILLLSVSFIIRSQNWQWAKNVSYSFTPNGNHLAAGDLGSFYMSTNSTTVGTCLSKFDVSGSEIWRDYINGSVAINGITCRSKRVFITGSFENSIIIGNDTLISLGLHDAFVACATSNGVFLWAKRFGGVKEDYSNDVCSDKKENIFITGQYSDTVKFGTSTFVCQGVYNMFMTKLDKYGNILLLKSAGCKDSLGGSDGIKIQADTLGNIVILGDFNDIVLDTNHIFDNSPYYHKFLCKLDSAGKTLWIESAMTGQTDLYDLSLDVSGNIFSSGWTGANIGGTSFTKKYKPSGPLQWQQACSGGWYSSASGDAIVTDDSNAFIVGYAELQFNSTYIDYNFFLLAKFDSTGALKYCDTIRIGLSSNNEWASGADIIRDSNGDFIIVGGMRGTFNLGSYSLTTPNVEVFIAKFSDNNISTDVVSKKYFDGSNIYPNPSSGIFTINLKNRAEKTQICVHDILGNCVYNKNYQNETTFNLNLSDHAKGIYLIEMISGNERSTKKVILE